MRDWLGLGLGLGRNVMESYIKLIITEHVYKTFHFCQLFLSNPLINNILMLCVGCDGGGGI